MVREKSNQTKFKPATLEQLSKIHSLQQVILSANKQKSYLTTAILNLIFLPFLLHYLVRSESGIFREAHQAGKQQYMSQGFSRDESRTRSFVDLMGIYMPFIILIPYALIFLGKKFIASILQVILPSHLFQDMPQSAEPEHLLSKSDAEKYIELLTQYKDKIIKNSRWGRWTRNVLSFFSFAKFLLNLSSLDIFTVSWFIVLATLSGRDLWEKNQQIVHHDALDKKYQKLVAVFKVLEVTVSKIDNGNISSSFFKIELNESSTQKIKPIVIAKDCIQKFNGTIFASNNKCIYIKADIDYSDSQIREMQEYLELALERHSILLSLTEQMKELADLFSQVARDKAELIERTLYDEIYLPSKEFILSIDKNSIRGNLESIFSKTFQDNIVTLDIRADEDILLIKIKGYTQAKNFDHLITNLPNMLKTNRLAVEQFVYEPRVKATSAHSYKDEAKPTHKDRSLPEKDTIQPEKEEEKLIEWESGKSSQNDIHPIVSRSLPVGKHFVLFKLKLEDFGNITGAYRKFKKIISNPHLVPKQKGVQGLVFCKSQPVYNTQGKVINAVIKAKIQGGNGNIRAYGREEKAENGETLYIFEAVKLKAHS